MASFGIIRLHNPPFGFSPVALKKSPTSFRILVVNVPIKISSYGEKEGNGAVEEMSWNSLLREQSSRCIHSPVETWIP